MSETCRKGQTSMGDFLIGFMLFIFVIILVAKALFTHMSSDSFYELEKEAYSISETLAGPGYPLDWTNETVVKLGLTDSYRLNTSKLSEYSKINYSDTRKYLGTKSDYVFFFKDHNSTLNISSCMFGSPDNIAGCEFVAGAEIEDIIKFDRLLIYNSSIVKMVVYVW